MCTTLANLLSFSLYYISMDKNCIQNVKAYLCDKCWLYNFVIAEKVPGLQNVKQI